MEIHCTYVKNENNNILEIYCNDWAGQTDQWGVSAMRKIYRKYLNIGWDIGKT